MRFFYFLFILSYINAVQAQDDLSVLKLEGEEINWQQFPDFELPFIVVYDGPVPSDGSAVPLRKGFSHISGGTTAYNVVIPKEKRVYLWTGIANADGWAKKTDQPWALAKLPWGNDIAGYRKAWWNRLKYITKVWSKLDSSEMGFDLIIADIENTLQSKSEILSVKYSPLVPESYRGLSDGEFINEYHRAMRELYNAPIQLLKDSIGSHQSVSSYGDTPIQRDWWGIQKHSWRSWRSDAERVNFLLKEDGGGPNSLFYDNLDYISPSAYYFYDPRKSSIGNNYLAYLLFQIEANGEWSNKKQLVFIWLNFHDSDLGDMEPITAEMAEASSIFPLISGAGIYNWRMAGNKKGNYEYFVRGLYRMSKFSFFFDGSEIYLKPTNPRDEFVGKSPIWRGVYNNGKLLIAAHNPHAIPGQKTKMKIQFEGMPFEFELDGLEVFLEEFDVN